MELRSVVCPGSFDPLTFGHLDIVERAARLFPECDIIVAVGANSQKQTLFTPAERVAQIAAACAAVPRVRVQQFSGLLVDFCRSVAARAVVKGLRSAVDFDFEQQQAQMNRMLNNPGQAEVETIFLPTSPQWGYLSSTLIRQIAAMDGDISAFLPPEIAGATRERIAAAKPTEKKASTTQTRGNK